MRHYSISEVESLTGLSAHVLRVWERRYAFLKAKRTETNIRYYTDSQLAKLLNVSILLDRGMKISQIAKLTDKEIGATVLDNQTNADLSQNDTIKLLTSATLKLDEFAISTLLEKAINSKGILKTVLELIYPFLHHIGLLWTSGNAMPAQEHFVSALIIQKLHAAIDKLPQVSSNEDAFVLLLLEEEEHELGLLLSWFLLRKNGIKVYYLGQKVPMENLETVLKISGAKNVFTFFVLEPKGHVLKSLVRCKKKFDVKIFYAGRKAAGLNEVSTHLELPSDLIKMIENQKK
ncbi:MAG: MerR family transcriptional regulator [Cytophagales bacterium]|nr:MerR family transcriptional regulator [Cytophagales bacterium]